MFGENNSQKELREKWQNMSEDEKWDTFLWKMSWRHSHIHVPGTPPHDAINRLADTIKIASNSSDRNSGVMTSLTRALVFVGKVQIFVAGFFSYQQIRLEQIGKEPLLQIVFEDVTLDKSWNFSAKIHFKNVGSVPVYLNKYGVTDFNAAYIRTTETPASFSNVVHQFFYGVQNVIAPGEEIVHPIAIKDLVDLEGGRNGIPQVWIGATYSRNSKEPLKCIELNYVPRADYQEFSNPARECGPWWPEQENHYEYNDKGEFVPTQ